MRKKSPKYTKLKSFPLLIENDDKYLQRKLKVARFYEKIFNNLHFFNPVLLASSSSKMREDGNG